jgi:hypothetical protein
MSIQIFLDRIKTALKLGSLGASMSFGNELLGARSDTFGKLTKQLIIVWFVGLFVLLLGTWFLFDTVNAFYDLDNKTVVHQNLVDDISLKEKQIDKIKTEHAAVLELAKYSPVSQVDLIEALSEAHRRSNMVVNKMTVGLPSNPDLISIESEGNYAALKMTLAELSSLSPSIDMKSITIAYQSAKGMLTLTTVLKFVPPPKIANTSKLSDASYMDGANSYKHPLYRKVEFSSNSSSGGKATAKQSTEVSLPKSTQTGATNNQALSSDRNPFYMPTPPSGAVGGDAPRGVSNDMPNGFSAQTTREPGVYVLGCMQMPNRSKEACVFQLSDGNNIVVNLGDKIESNIRLVKINKDTITISVDKKRTNFKVGERIR